MKILPENYSPTEQCLQGRIIAVTGAGAGIGKTMAQAYASYGATVILMGKTIAKLEHTYDTIEQAGYPQPAILPIDFAHASSEQFQAIHKDIEEHFGQLHGLLHNAAMLGERTSIGSYTLTTWEKVIRTNVTAPFALTSAVLPLLQKSRNASIIFTGSSVGMQGRAYWGAYAASKAATDNLMQTLADEMDATSQIRVNSINPGATRTAMRADAYPAEDPTTVKPAESLIPLYTYLISEDSIGTNGQQFSA